MADNVAVTEGSGKNVATDEIQVDGSHTQGQVQFVKLVDGTLNGTASIRVDVGGKANALRVAPANDITDGTYIGDIKFGESLPANTNTQEVVGDVAENENAAGNPLLCGGRYDSSPRTLGNTDVGAIALAVDGAVHIDDGGNTITIDGSITTVSTVTNLAQMGGTAITMDEGAHDAGTQRVTIATDDDGVAYLATIAGDTTSMDGNITACNTGAVVLSSGTVTTVSTVTNLAQLGGTAITMDEGVHDAGCQRVTLATDDDGVLSLGVIDDWDATHDSAVSADGPQLMAAYDATKPTAVADGDAVRVLADEYGRLLAGVEKTAWQEDYDSADASGEGETVKASAASTIVVVQSYIISSDTELWVKLQEEDSTALTGKFWLKAGGGVAITLPDKAPLILGVDSDLEVITEGAGDVSVSATGYTIPG